MSPETLAALNACDDDVAAEQFRKGCGADPWINLVAHVSDDFAFRWACFRGHLETARWLVSLDLEWSHWDLTPLKAWSALRDSWIRAVVSG